LAHSMSSSGEGCIYQARWEGTARVKGPVWVTLSVRLHLPSPLGGHCKRKTRRRCRPRRVGCIYQARWEGTARSL